MAPPSRTPISAIPNPYFFIFGIYEPLMGILCFYGSLSDPVKFHNAQAPWPAGAEPFTELPHPTFVAITLLSHVCSLLGLINFSVLVTAHKYLKKHPALQEKVVFSLLAPLLFSDIFHLGFMLWALGDSRWNASTWSSEFKIGLSFSIMTLVPRLAWHLGVRRYVHSRDGDEDDRKED